MKTKQGFEHDRSSLNATLQTSIISVRGDFQWAQVSPV
jgi:hypothetical protein